MARVEIPYNPGLTIEYLYSLIYNLIPPEYPTRTKSFPLGGKAIIIKEHMLSVCMIQIKHKPKKNLTYINIRAGTDTSFGAILVQVILDLLIIGIIFLMIALATNQIDKKFLPIVEEVADKHLRGNSPASA